MSDFNLQSPSKIPFADLEPPEETRKNLMFHYEKQSTLDSFEPLELSNPINTYDINNVKFNFTIKDLQRMRNLHILFSIDQPKKTYDFSLEKQRQLLQGILTVVIWKIEGNINDDEFEKLYNEWQENKEVNCKLTDLIHLKTLDEEITITFLKNALSNISKKPEKCDDLLNPILISLNQFFNKYLLTAPELGIDFTGRQIPHVSELWIETAEKLFSVLDPENLGIIDAERLLYFLLALIAEDLAKNYESSEDIHSIIKAELQNTLNEMDHYFGTITKQDFKIFLLKRGLSSSKGLTSILSELIKIVNTINSVYFKESLQNQYLLISNCQLSYPPIIEQSFINSMKSMTFLKQFLTDSCNSSIPQFLYLSNHIENFANMLDPTELQMLEIYQFLKLHLFKTCFQSNFLEGLHFIKSLTNCSKELACRFLQWKNKKYAGDIKIIEQNICNFLQYYDLLISDIIDSVMKFYGKIDKPIQKIPENKFEGSRIHELAQKIEIKKAASPPFEISKDAQIYENSASRKPIRQTKSRVVTLALDIKSNEIITKPSKSRNLPSETNIQVSRQPNSHIASKSFYMERNQTPQILENMPKNCESIIVSSKIKNQTKSPILTNRKPILMQKNVRSITPIKSLNNSKLRNSENLSKSTQKRPRKIETTQQVLERLNKLVKDREIASTSKKEMPKKSNKFI